jgi:hypothetical protein
MGGRTKGIEWFCFTCPVSFLENEENASYLCLVAEVFASLLAEHWFACSRFSEQVHLSLRDGNERGKRSNWSNPPILRTGVLSSQHR